MGISPVAAMTVQNSKERPESKIVVTMMMTMVDDDDKRWEMGWAMIFLMLIWRS
jgi:hypothetical protein